jgi:hypothetical protein
MTYEEAHALFVYDPETGLLTNRVSRRYGQIAAGTEIGCLHHTGYVVLSVGKKQHRAHRVAWLLGTGAWPTGSIDHINGVKDDNRLVNLRDADSTTQQRNQGLNKDNKSGLAGVFILKSGRVRATINYEGRRHVLGTYLDYFEAVCARKSAEVKHGYTGRL